MGWKPPPLDPSTAWWCRCTPLQQSGPAVLKSIGTLWIISVETDSVIIWASERRAAVLPVWVKTEHWRKYKVQREKRWGGYSRAPSKWKHTLEHLTFPFPAREDLFSEEIFPNPSHANSSYGWLDCIKLIGEIRLRNLSTLTISTIKPYLNQVPIQHLKSLMKK